MDALTKLNEHFLSCNICTQIFKDPCTIGCQHTFCRVCLTKYTKTRRDAISSKSILCPNCCQMTKVPRPQEPVDQWCLQFKPSFLIQGLLDTFSSQGSSGIDSVEHCCFTCQQMGKTTQAKSDSEDCDILFCEACAKMHVALPMAASHVISPLGAGSTPQLKKRRVMCKEHNCLVEFCCKDCKKAVCNKCCIVYHRKCDSVVTLDSMIPEMKQVLQQDYEQIKSKIEHTEQTLKCRRSEVEEITQYKSSLQSEIRRVSQQAVDLIRRKEKKLLGELDELNEKETGDLSLIKAGEIYLQTYQQYTEFIKQVLQSNSPMDLFDMYTLCQSGEITDQIQKHEKQEENAAGCTDPPSIDVLDLSGRVLRSVITPCTGQQLIRGPLYMCTTRQGHIVVADMSDSVYCVTQQGEVLHRHQLTKGVWLPGRVTTTDTGSVIIADTDDNKIVQLTESGQYVSDLLTEGDGIDRPVGIRIHGNKLYVTEHLKKHVKIFQL